MFKPFKIINVTRDPHKYFYKNGIFMYMVFMVKIYIGTKIITIIIKNSDFEEKKQMRIIQQKQNGNDR